MQQLSSGIQVMPLLSCCYSGYKSCINYHHYYFGFFRIRTKNIHGKIKIYCNIRFSHAGR